MVRCVKDDDVTLEQFIAEHVEIQNAVMTLKDDSDTVSHTIFKFCLDCYEKHLYEKMLCMVFNKVARIENSNKINSYVILFEQHKENISSDGEYKLYRVSSSKKFDCKESFLCENVNLSKKNPYIMINVCGFTLEEIREEIEINQLISCFPCVYILFSGKYSVGAYVLKDGIVI